MSTILLGYIGIVIMTLINALIAFLVFIQHPKSATHRNFFIFVGGSVLWGAGIVSLVWTQNFLFDKVILYGGLLMVFGFYLFTTTFPTPTKESKHNNFLILPFLIVALLIPFNLFIEKTLILADHSLKPINTPLYPLYTATIGFYIILGFIFFIKKYRHARGLERLQMQYLILGATVFLFIALIADSVLPAFGIFNFNLLGPISSVALVGLTGYAIVRHQLLDIRLVIQRGLIYSLLFAIIVCFYIASLFTLEHYLFLTTHTTNFASALLTIFAGVFGIPYIEKYFRDITDRWFHKGRYKYSEALHALSESLNRNLELDGLVRDTSLLLSQILKSKTVRVVVFAEFPLIYIDGKLSIDEKSLPNKAVVKTAREALLKFPNIITHSSLRAYGIKNISTHMLEALVALGMGGRISLSIPLMLDKKVMGVINIGEKRSGDAYTKEDVVLLKTFAYEASIALEKSELYKAVRDYSLELETRVSERTIALKKIQEEQRQMMVDISHALQTPLTIIKGSIEIMNIRGEHNNELGVAETALDEASQLLYDMMSLAQLENEKEEGSLANVDLSQLALEVAEYVRVIALAKNINIKTHLIPGITVKGNEKQLKDVVINLMSNAVKYMGGGSKRNITLSLETTECTAVLKVADTGRGLKDNDRTMIFQRFYRTKEARDEGVRGTGLGLAIAQTILKKHGGTIHVESEEGVGSTFIVTLPLNK